MDGGVADESGFVGVPPYFDLCDGLTPDAVDYDRMCQNIWLYIMNYTSDGPKSKWDQDVVLKVLKDSQIVLSKEPMVPKVEGKTIILGPIYGEGDSMVTLLSQSGFTPEYNYVMLGCYGGAGFAPFECLMFALAQKNLHPNKVYPLKGHHEETSALEKLKARSWINCRGIIETPVVEEIMEEIKKTCSILPCAVILNSTMLCIPGGPGPLLRKHGLEKLLEVQKNTTKINEKNLLMEAAWAVMILNESQRDLHGMPSFTPAEATEFCKSNNIECIIRGRQLVDEGFLNKPKEVITLMSAVAYLDNFRNYAACLKVDKKKGVIVRYKMEEGEQMSLELIKPGMGRNAVG